MVNKKKVLITGSTGLVGSNLLRRCLKEGAEVHIITTSTSNRWRLKDVLDNIHEHCADLLDYIHLAKVICAIEPEIIFHLAAYGVYVYEEDVNKIMETNIMGTINLLNACKNIEFELLVNTGSVFEYGIKSVPLKENDLLEPVSNYGVSKTASTLYCQALAKRENRPIVTLRLFTPYGYYEKPPRLIPSAILSCLNGESPKLSSPDSVRDFVFIEDVVDAYLKVVENSNKAKGEIFNIGYGKQYSVREVVDAIVKLTGNKAEPEWGSISDSRVDSKMWEANISKAKKMLNWQPEYNLNGGLRRTVEWFKENISLYKNRYCGVRRY